MDSNFAIIFSAVFISNIVLSQFLGICSFLGVSKSLRNALGMSAAVAFVMVLASLISWLVYYLFLAPYDLTYLKTIVFILAIASLVQLVEMFIKKFSPALYKSLGIYLPLITTNCAVLGVALDNISNGFTFPEMIVYSLGIPIGFTLVLYIFATIRERLDAADIPNAFKGNPIALIVAALMALAFSGFAGLV